jgi:trehalose 6-phosphate synthase
MPDRLVIVRNRLPTPPGPDGGGQSELDLAATEGRHAVLWFGWNGQVGSECSQRTSIARHGGTTYAGIDLSIEQFEGYLNGFANSTLWPLLHEMPDRVAYHADDLAVYRAVNARFAAQLRPLLLSNDLIWIQDYHLIPLGWMLRNAGVENPIGFSLHTPFPSARRLTKLPWQRKLAFDLAAYDLVGLQSDRDLWNCNEFLGGQHKDSARRRSSVPMGKLPSRGVHQRGIQTRSLMELASSHDVRSRTEKLASSLGNRRIIVGSDRLDYTNGLLPRLRAYEKLLDNAPECQGSVSLVQVTAPSRALVPGYLELRMDQSALADRINQRFVKPGWLPILDLYAKLPLVSKTALNRLGDVGIALPRRDGATLAAKEYLAAQDPNDPGVLVLSRHAGAAELLSDAILVDARDATATARAIAAALRMPLDERQDLWRRQIVKLLHNDAEHWHHNFVHALWRVRNVPTADVTSDAEVTASVSPIRVPYRHGALPSSAPPIP